MPFTILFLAFHFLTFNLSQFFLSISALSIRDLGVRGRVVAAKHEGAHAGRTNSRRAREYSAYHIQNSGPHWQPLCEQGVQYSLVMQCKQVSVRAKKLLLVIIWPASRFLLSHIFCGLNSLPSSSFTPKDLSLFKKLFPSPSPSFTFSVSL